MGHHGIKILCGFSFYSTEYFRGVGGCAFWLMRLLAFNLWHIVPSVSAPSELSIYIDIYCVPTSLQGCEDHYSAQYSWSSITEKRAKNSKQIFFLSIQSYSSAIFSFSLFSLLHFRLKRNFTNCLLDRNIWLFILLRKDFSEKNIISFGHCLNYPRLILSAQ